jgi:large subunit ribosomal protein L18
MANIAQKRIKIRKSRHKRIRRSISGTSASPRLCVRRSLKNVVAQIIDDEAGISLLQLSSLQKDVVASTKDCSKTEQSKIVGKKIGEMAVEKGIKKVVFDRGGNLYHGRVKALADAAREAGLQF